MIRIQIYYNCIQWAKNPRIILVWTFQLDGHIQQLSPSPEGCFSYIIWGIFGLQMHVNQFEVEKCSGVSTVLIPNVRDKKRNRIKRNSPIPRGDRSTSS